jgi:hypothetical protein
MTEIVNVLTKDDTKKVRQELSLKYGSSVLHRRKFLY